MLGNVRAWRANDDAPDYDALVLNPCATEGPVQLHRGGRWFLPVATALAARRNPRTPNASIRAVGLRLAQRGPRGQTAAASPRPHPRPTGSGSQST